MLGTAAESVTDRLGADKHRLALTAGGAAPIFAVDGVSMSAATKERGTPTVPCARENISRSPANQYSCATTSRPLQKRIVVSAAASGSAPSMIDAPSTTNAAVVETTLGLTARILTFIDAPSAADFDTLALDVHAYQYRHNPPYRRFVDQRDGAQPRSWAEIPAIPALAFKETALACAPAERIYESSGTTEGPARRALHHVPDVVLYRTAALAGFHRAVLPVGERRPFLVAAPESASHPASSLGEMVSWLREAHDSGATTSFLADGGLDLAGLAHALDELDPARPVVLVAVTAALLRLADHARNGRRRWQLPAGSLVIDTGGCKGYATNVPRAEILARYAEVIGVLPEQVVNEYGMTEMCSQLYATGLAPLQAPPWVRTLVCDPETGRVQPAGRAGLLRHFDLANLGSVMAVQTEDIGREVGGGIDLLGRAAHAEPRGCSLLLAG